jgi:hypothetical protein
MIYLLLLVIFWILCGFYGTLLIIRAEEAYDSGYFNNVTITDLFTTVWYVLCGPWTLYLCYKWMMEEEGLGDTKVSDISLNIFKKK